MNSPSIAFQHATDPSPHCQRLLVIQRRLRVSPSVAHIYADHAYGSQRTDLIHLAALTAARCAEGGR